MTVQNNAPMDTTALVSAAKSETVNAAPKAEAAEVKTESSPKRDTFTRSADSESIGLYKPGSSENGKSKVSFDAPKAKPETVKADTNNAAATLKKLTSSKQQLKIQLKTADPAKRAKLEKKLKALDAQINKARLSS